MNPEEQTRYLTGEPVALAGGTVQGRSATNRSIVRGVAGHEFELSRRKARLPVLLRGRALGLPKPKLKGTVVVGVSKPPAIHGPSALGQKGNGYGHHTRSC